MRLLTIFLFFTAIFSTGPSIASLSTYNTYDKERFIYGIKKQKPHELDKSFSVTPDDFDIVLIKDLALSQPFLLKTSIISTLPVPTGRSLASKIVTFEKKGGSVYLFESTDGKLSSLSLPTKILLAEFPIIKETETEIVIDFKKGMKELYYINASFASDLQKGPQENVFKISKSYISRVEKREKALFIDHLVRIDIPNEAHSSKQLRMSQLKYVLVKYKKNENFKSKPSTLMKRVGYFELPPVYDPKEPNPLDQKKVNILKFDHKKDIVYHLSSNIPQVYREAVIDGILYWNRVFEKEVLKIKDLPKNILPHEPGFNIVQWLDWDTAGFAYADISPDPLTGEIIQSHIYLTSVFGSNSRNSAKNFLLRVLANKKKKPKTGPELEIKGFKNNHFCHKKLKNAFTPAAMNLLKMSEDLNDKKFEKLFLRFSQDFLRQVVAHEVGHTLGLRHNFAASTLTNLSKENWKNIITNYFFTGESPPNLLPASSVMDYTSGETASLLGAHIRLNKKALPYDKMAIDWAYLEKQVTVNVPFCSDGLYIKRKFADCRPWDQFNNPIEHGFHKWENMFELFSFTTALKFNFLGNQKIDNKARILKSVLLQPKKEATFLISPLLYLIKNTHKKIEFLKIKNSNPMFNTLDIDLYNETTREFKKKEYKRFGGLGKLFLERFIPKDKELSPFFQELKEKVYLNINNLFKTDQLDSFSKEELEKTLKKYFFLLEREFLIILTRELSEAEFGFKDRSFLKKLKPFVQEILFQKGKKTFEFSSEIEFPKYYPRFYQALERDLLRGNIIDLLNHDNFPSSPTYMKRKSSLRKKVLNIHENEIKNILKDQLLDEVQNDDLYDFLYLEQKLFKPLKKAEL